MANYAPTTWATGDTITSTKLNNIENGLNNLTIAGTTSQVLVNGATTAVNNAAITLTLPQSIATTSNPTFAQLQLTSNMGIGDDPASYPEDALIVVLARTVGAGTSGGSIYVGSALTSTGDGSGNILFGERLNCGVTLAASALRGRATQLYIDGKTASIGGGATLTNHNAAYFGTPVNGSTVNVIDSACGATLPATGVWTDNPSWARLKEAIQPVAAAEVASMFDWVRDAFQPVRYRYKTRTEMQTVPVFEEQDMLADVTIAGKKQKAKVGTRRVQVGVKDEEVTLTKHQDYMYDHFGYLLDDLPANMRQIVLSDPNGGISGKDERGLLWALVQEAARRIKTLSDRVATLEAA